MTDHATDGPWAPVRFRRLCEFIEREAGIRVRARRTSPTDDAAMAFREVLRARFDDAGRGTQRWMAAHHAEIEPLYREWLAAEDAAVGASDDFGASWSP
jgi:hypothetical protein